MYKSNIFMLRCVLCSEQRGWRAVIYDDYAGDTIRGRKLYETSYEAKEAVALRFVMIMMDKMDEM